MKPDKTKSQLINIIARTRPNSVTAIGGEALDLMVYFFEIFKTLPDKTRDLFGRLDFTGIVPLDYSGRIPDDIREKIRSGTVMEIIDTIDRSADLVIMAAQRQKLGPEKYKQMINSCRKIGRAILIIEPKSDLDPEIDRFFAFAEKEERIRFEHNEYHIAVYSVPRNRLEFPIAKNLYLVLSMKRAGQHAIINWICRQAKGGIAHLNHPPLFDYFKDDVTFLESVWLGYENDFNPKMGYHRVSSYRGKHKLDSFHVAPSTFIPFPYTEIDNLIINFEDFDIDYLKDNPGFLDRVGPEFKRIIPIVINRDPFNWVASCLARKGADVERNIETRINLWKKLVRESLDKSILSANDPIFLNYNKWFDSKPYRRDLAERLSLDFTDSGIDEVSIKGDGSSFDGRAYDKNAGKMKVLERWRKFETDPRFRKLLDDDLVSLSKKYFEFTPDLPDLPHGETPAETAPTIYAEPRAAASTPKQVPTASPVSFASKSPNEKKLVVLLGRADWAGSCNSVCRAVNRIGDVECRHVSLNEHMFGYPSDVVIPICYTQNPKRAQDYPEQYRQALELFEQADLIHLWNDPLPAFKGLLPIPTGKVKSNTFTGTLYRQNHTEINRYLKEQGTELVVQNPTYRYPEEYDAEFIPHAVDTDLLKPLSLEQRESGAVGCYRPKHKSTTAHEDIALLEKLVAENYPGWHLTLDWTMPWETRMKLMPKCTYFFEYMDPNMGYWGRSALEACAMGVPTFSYVSEKACRMSMGRLGNPEIIHVTKANLEKTLERYLSLSTEQYADLSQRSRAWLGEHYGFEKVGKLYTEFFNKILAPGKSTLSKPTLTITGKKESPYLRDRTVQHVNGNVGRNDPCPCGSGLKYKKCCLAKETVI